MKTHELAKILLDMPDVDVFVSVDVSKGEDDSEARVFGDIIEVQNNGGPYSDSDVSILCIED